MSLTSLGIASEGLLNGGVLSIAARGLIGLAAVSEVDDLRRILPDRVILAQGPDLPERGDPVPRSDIAVSRALPGRSSGAPRVALDGRGNIERRRLQ